MSERSDDRQQAEAAAAAPALKPAFNLDLSIMGDNVEDMAGFTLAKYEFQHPQLSPERRVEALARMKAALWERIEQAKRDIERRRKEVLSEMFQIAEKTLHDMVRSEE